MCPVSKVLDMDTRLLPYKVFGYLVVVLVALVVLAGVAMVVYVIYYYVFAGVFARTSQVPAVVLRKKQRCSDSGDVPLQLFASGGDYVSPMYEDPGTCDFFVVFDVGGKELEFPVSESVYGSVMEGDTGLLVHRGNLFKRFIPTGGSLDTSAGRAEIRKV